MISEDPKLPQLTVREQGESYLSTRWIKDFIRRFYELWRETALELRTIHRIATTESWASYYPGSFVVPTNTGRLFISQMTLVGAQTASVIGTGTIRIV